MHLRHHYTWVYVLLNLHLPPSFPALNNCLLTRTLASRTFAYLLLWRKLKQEPYWSRIIHKMRTNRATLFLGGRGWKILNGAVGTPRGWGCLASGNPAVGNGQWPGPKKAERDWSFQELTDSQDIATIFELPLGSSLWPLICNGKTKLKKKKHPIASDKQFPNWRCSDPKTIPRPALPSEELLQPKPESHLFYLLCLS